MPGVFVSGTINWLTYDASSSLHVIVSLDLENESYQNLLKPDTKKDYWILGKLRNCLCIFTGSKIDMLVDVWIMKEYGNTKPWTKLYTVPYMGDQVSSSKALYISEDGKVLMGFQELLFVYDSENGTFNMPGFQNISGWLDPEVYVESLISPCS
ncbi:putative F-box associated interaction domain-containing protein [Medicago truncatula]|uniref:Putative F-box associated interaction domain-containing protein n=2 Tax=Medicago truncatula TaxID=3880 RepID=A0A396IJC1_MEDTR|nr:putative F-box associated interaction domain-containing protein [Medicago truncatula]